VKPAPWPHPLARSVCPPGAVWGLMAPFP